ncbi:MAG: Phenylacetic acid-responsive transcriptional repressor [Candidatus Kaiserbacteria bacterium GW2011_GWA2_58_9]|uniref:Phenylacetic acid-responsive transcriptional repressor n=2 Tax=Candidatus Kaiseribacteriota TaxID=1752734 RepID=A0A0G2B229_9BACT|nr:MAG: Phenylacetic acid-responsive transcriptional repressor [Candidatus Kaiserbacteria bacterium GW2011_GWA2_58_9]
MLHGMNGERGKRDLFDIRTGKELLVALLLGGGMLTLMGTAPWLLAAGIPAAMMLKDSPKNRRKLSYSWWYAKKRKYISAVPRSGKTLIELTEEGKRVAAMHLLKMRAHQASRPKTWDRKWRLILFDVSMEDHLKRNAFRHLIKRLGAIKLQQSVWIYPHDCSEEISFLVKVLGFDERQVRVVVAETIGDDRAFRRHYKV